MHRQLRKAEPVLPGPACRVSHVLRETTAVDARTNTSVRPRLCRAFVLVRPYFHNDYGGRAGIYHHEFGGVTVGFFFFAFYPAYFSWELRSFFCGNSRPNTGVGGRTAFANEVNSFGGITHKVGFFINFFVSHISPLLDELTMLQ
jgi:hypothetical protein